MKLSRTPLPKQTGGPHGPRGKDPIDTTLEQLQQLAEDKVIAADALETGLTLGSEDTEAVNIAWAVAREAATEALVFEVFKRNACVLTYRDELWYVDDQFGESLGESDSLTDIATSFLDDFEEHVSCYYEGSDGQNHLLNIQRDLKVLNL